MIDHDNDWREQEHERMAAIDERAEQDARWADVLPMRPRATKPRAVAQSIVRSVEPSTFGGARVWVQVWRVGGRVVDVIGHWSSEQAARAAMGRAA